MFKSRVGGGSIASPQVPTLKYKFIQKKVLRQVPRFANDELKWLKTSRAIAHNLLGPYSFKMGPVPYPFMVGPGPNHFKVGPVIYLHLWQQSINNQTKYAQMGVSPLLSGNSVLNCPGLHFEYSFQLHNDYLPKVAGNLKRK